MHSGICNFNDGSENGKDSICGEIFFLDCALYFRKALYLIYSKKTLLKL